MKPIWRPMGRADLPSVKHLSDAIYPPALSESAAVYADRLALYPQGCFLLVDGDEALGYLLTHPWERGSPPKIDRPIGALPQDCDCYYVHDLALLPQARGSGAARAALDMIRNAMAREGLRVAQLVAVGGADAFWGRMGFMKVAGADPGYGPDACLMQMEI